MQEYRGIMADESKEFDVLDSTRIHPYFYPMAKRIALEAIDDVNNDQEDPVSILMRNPKRLQDLDLDDYAKHFRQRSKQNMKVLIDLIVQEFTHPFQDPRAEFNTKLKKEDLFYTLTKESKFSLREESIINVRITRLD